MLFGWTGTILNINLTEKSIKKENTAPYTRKYIGGRILAARLAWERIPPGTGPFDSKNIIIITTGPLTGTIAPTSGRTVMSMISPVPYPFTWYSHSTLGGWFGPEMKYAGYDAILIQGKSSEQIYLKITDTKVEFVNAAQLWGNDALETQEILKGNLSPFAQVLSIGPAGENLVRLSTVQHDYDCAAGHSGFGAVWGSKNLKAIIVHGTGDVRVAHPDQLLNEIRRIDKFPITPSFEFLALENGEQAAKQLPGPVCSQSCTNNCKVGRYLETQDFRTINSYCIIHALTKFMQSEYKRPATDLQIPAVKNYSCEKSVALVEKLNRLGIDFWTRVTFQSWFTALARARINEIHGFSIDPDDGDWFINFLEEMANRKGLGGFFADGLARALDKLSEEIPEKLIRLGREIVFAYGFQAHREGRFWDKEPLPFWIFSAMMYISETRDPTIGSHSLLHLAEIQITHKEEARKKFRILSEKVWNDPGALEPNFKNKAPVAIWCQRMHFLIDSLTLCDFAFPRLIKHYRCKQEWLEDDDICGDLELGERLIEAVTGEHFSHEELDQAADRGMSIERCMLARSGRTREHEEKLASHFQLPCRDDDTSISLEGFLKLIDEYYAKRGWDMEYGWPLADTLIDLGLSDVAEEIEIIKAAKRRDKCITKKRLSQE